MLLRSGQILQSVFWRLKDKKSLISILFLNRSRVLNPLISWFICRSCFFVLAPWQKQNCWVRLQLRAHVGGADVSSSCFLHDVFLSHDESLWLRLCPLVVVAADRRQLLLKKTPRKRMKKRRRSSRRRSQHRGYRKDYIHHYQGIVCLRPRCTEQLKNPDSCPEFSLCCCFFFHRVARRQRGEEDELKEEDAVSTLKSWTDDVGKKNMDIELFKLFIRRCSLLLHKLTHLHMPHAHSISTSSVISCGLLHCVALWRCPPR